MRCRAPTHSAASDRHTWHWSCLCQGRCCRGKGGMRGVVGSNSGTELAGSILWAGLEQLETGSFHSSGLCQCSHPLHATGCGMSSCSHSVITLCQWREDAFKSCTSARGSSGSSHHESWAIWGMQDEETPSQAL